MAKRLLHPFCPRPDTILYISPLFSSASSHSVSSCWCKCPGNGTSHCHPESTLCSPSLTNPLFCFCSSFSLNPSQEISRFPRNLSVTKSSAFGPLLIIFYISSRIQDGNFLIHCSESWSRPTPPP